mmetsp:Transcript_32567/g.91482  ORF Transcript_32567/g.91482 Transcript_32567/m.91482 type:complete len:252 (+) Transcript_32567:123-878(+)
MAAATSRPKGRAPSSSAAAAAAARVAEPPVPASSSSSAAAKPKSSQAPRKGFKLVLLGDASVGKSSILMRFLQNTFTEVSEATVGAAFSTKTIESGNRQVKFEIWDTAGQERFRSLAPMYYRGASSAVVVYDQTSPVTFERAQEWVRQVMQTSSNPNIVVALAANKMDLADQRQVPLEKAEAFAAQEGLLLSETSAKTGKNVAQLFETIASHLPEEPFVPEQRGLVMSQAAPATLTSSAKAAPAQRQGCCL